nr:hypothetical protein [uncultured Rhodopila sp.]
MRWLSRRQILSQSTIRTLPWMLAALAAACAHDPIRYIPETDRTMLQAQDRLGNGDGNGQPISVDEMLRRAKTTGESKPPSTRIMIRFDGDTVQPDAAQRDTLRRFAEQAHAGSLTVISHPGNFDDAGSPVLGQRRAIAVSRELSDIVADVQMRFEPAVPPGIVVVSFGRPAVRAVEPDNPAP